MELKEKILNLNSEKFSDIPYKKKINVHKVLDFLVKPFEKEKQAERCSSKYFNVEGHKYYKKSKEEILDLWNKKAEASRNLGNNLDEYIGLKFENENPNSLKIWKLDHDLNTHVDLKSRCEGVDELVDVFKRLDISFMFREVPLFCSYQGHVFSGREDAVFQGLDRLILVDWKSGAVSVENKWDNMLGPCSHLQDSQLNRYSLQLYFYKWFLEHEYGVKEKIDPYVIQFVNKDEITNTGSYHVYKPSFPYDEKLIEKILDFALVKNSILDPKE